MCFGAPKDLQDSHRRMTSPLLESGKACSFSQKCLHTANKAPPKLRTFSRHRRHSLAAVATVQTLPFQQQYSFILIIMPNVQLPSGQDWDDVNAGKSGAGRTKAPKSAREITAAKASGKLTTERRYVCSYRNKQHWVVESHSRVSRMSRWRSLAFGMERKEIGQQVPPTSASSVVHISRRFSFLGSFGRKT